MNSINEERLRYVGLMVLALTMFLLNLPELLQDLRSRPRKHPFDWMTGLIALRFAALSGFRGQL